MTFLGEVSLSKNDICSSVTVSKLGLCDVYYLVSASLVAVLGFKVRCGCRDCWRNLTHMSFTVELDEA